MFIELNGTSGIDAAPRSRRLVALRLLATARAAAATARWAAGITTAGLLCLGASCPPGPPPPPPQGPPPVATDQDVACPTMIPDQASNTCPRLKNATLSCGGNGMLHTSLGGGSGSPILVGARLDDGSVLSAVLVFVNCQDGPREGVTFGVTYTGEVATPPTAPPCIRQSKAAFSQFRFGNPIYAGFEGLAKDKVHQALDDEAIKAFAGRLGLAVPAISRCSIWRQMP